MSLVATHPRPTTGVADAPPARSRADTPARFTVELPRAQHRFVKRFALDADSDASRVARALLTLLECDPELGERVRELIRR